MNRSNRSWLVVVVAIAMLGVGGCTDDIVDIPIEEAVEAGLDAAIQDTVEPLFEFFGTISALLAVPAPSASRLGLPCPDTSSWCSTGSVACTVTTSGLEFDFDECVVVTGEAPLTLDGVVVAVPGNPVVLTLNNLFINNSPAMSGTGSINTSNCNYVFNVTSTDGVVVSGVVVVCPTDQYPSGNQLFIGFDDFLAVVTFNSTNIVPVAVTQGTTPVVSCTIDLDSDPLSSSCDAI